MQVKYLTTKLAELNRPDVIPYESFTLSQVMKSVFGNIKSFGYLVYISYLGGSIGEPVNSQYSIETGPLFTV
jgi:hypothetical protein